MARRSISRRSREADEYEEEPRSRRRDDDEQDEAPRRSRGRSRRDDDEEEPPRGRRSSRSRDDEDDDAPRSRRSSRSRDDDEEDDRPRRSRRDRDDDEPKRKRSTSSTVGKGWGGYESVKGSGSDYVNAWKIPTKRTLIKILDAEPFATYAEHWLDDRKGKKSFVCLGEDCPLCDDLGDRPSGYALFNILDLTDPDNPKVEAWKTGKRVAGTLKEYAEDKKTSPLNREDLYWSIFKSGDKGGNMQTNLNPVKARDLEDDWDCPPFTEDELADFEKDFHTEEELIYVNSRKELRAIAAEYDD